MFEAYARCAAQARQYQQRGIASAILVRMAAYIVFYKACQLRFAGGGSASYKCTNGYRARRRAALLVAAKRAAAVLAQPTRHAAAAAAGVGGVRCRTARGTHGCALRQQRAILPAKFLRAGGSAAGMARQARTAKANEHFCNELCNGRITFSSNEKY
ncbi:hypothetical protein NPIL_381041 [Nephila pilipes]|uniref:Uncharacterized protein n=1 Tax=Nephila pilipes TaxID=299642 RepID=A0A8X6JX16_NEPPI|nr:hypothetical protein NPIL_381041 [Nephila pilipes]